jgi:hypothetical protein
MSEINFGLQSSIRKTPALDRRGHQRGGDRRPQLAQSAAWYRRRVPYDRAHLLTSSAPWRGSAQATAGDRPLLPRWADGWAAKRNFSPIGG